jgi:LPXTG-motif cell wall-anchored protein
MSQIAANNGMTDASNHVAAGEERSKTALIVAWIAQVLVALIFAQSLFFKFTYAAETQLIFADLGGRLGATAVGVMELIAAILLLVPRLAALGALLSLATISGAILSHLFILGIAIVDPATGESDGGVLFGMALGIFVLSAVVLVIRRRQLPLIGDRLP